MPHPRRIVIILSDTLQSFGLQHILTDYFPPVEITLCDCFARLNKENTDTFDYYFTSADNFVLYADFFLPRKNKTIVLTPTPNPSCPANNGLYLYPDASPETIIEQLQLLFAQENTFNLPGENNKELSQRETDVLQLIVKGITNKEIADRLNISLNTVLTHRKNITAKLAIKTVSGLTFYAIMNGIISGDEIKL
ncbi:response regulator transcription factor [Parabacteroides sp. PF5-6]|uniref:response regulator transcription factor n=1 Tax=Parabacteroides sp. PF5-6 TaxID=1742403 RepID=UPI00240674F4|nr:response regulator transcription factor [Parabacteroides sp. PF5-6]MDF9828878.1 DNA-binding CsgD family transcriptional regulator [Parabacteroides sp. PF5-6]